MHGALGGLQMRHVAPFQGELRDQAARSDVLHHGLPASPTDLYAGGRGRGLEHIERGEELAKQVVPLHGAADDAADTKACVDADPARHVLAPTLGPIAHGLDHREAETDHGARGGILAQRRLGLGGDVGVAHGLHLVEAPLVGERVETAKDLPDHFDHLLGCALADEGSETAQVGLDHRRALKNVLMVVEDRRLQQIVDEQRRHQGGQHVSNALLHQQHTPHHAVTLAAPFVGQVVPDQDQARTVEKNECQDEAVANTVDVQPVVGESQHANG
mmetsp:Transcript_47724/g.139105  ORF Transcript_47724/g.139105 Transcript_47724/m.139105 type:complete len:273 (+) Transcript_47724:151-969(+)